MFWSLWEFVSTVNGPLCASWPNCLGMFLGMFNITVYLCLVFLSQCSTHHYQKRRICSFSWLLLIFSIIPVLVLVRHFSGTFQLCNLEKSICFLLLEQVTAGLEIGIMSVLSLASTNPSSRNAWLFLERVRRVKYQGEVESLPKSANDALGCALCELLRLIQTVISRVAWADVSPHCCCKQRVFLAAFFQKLISNISSLPFACTAICRQSWGSWTEEMILERKVNPNLLFFLAWQQVLLAKQGSQVGATLWM